MTASTPGVTTAFGRKRTLKSVIFEQCERPLSEKRTLLAMYFSELTPFSSRRIKAVRIR